MAKIKPGTPHPTRGGMVMGLNSRYVSKGTYARQKSAAKGNNPSTNKTTTKPTPRTPTKTTKVLPSAGNTSATKSTPRYFPKGQVSSRRSQAAAKQVRAGQGVKGGSRIGQPSGSANRQFGANIVDAATGRAQRSSAARGIGRGVRGLVGGRGGALAIANALKPVTDRIAKEAVRGAKVVTGQPNQGRPNVKSVNGVDFNLATQAGQNGYAKAIAKQRSKNNKKPASTPSTTTTTKASKPSTTTKASKPSTTKTSTPKTSTSKSKAKPDNRSTLTKEIDGLTTFIATHKGKEGMKRALDQAAKRLAEKKKKKGSRSSLMSGNVKSNSTTG